MKKPNKLRYRLLAPLVYTAAILLLLEEWLWDIGARMVGFIASWPPIRLLENWIKALPPYPALAVFLAPAVLLFPVKILALFAITRGHAIMGVSVILIAKVAGAAAVARLYALTKPKLLSLDWFARWHGKFIAVRDRWIARLRATRAWRRVSALRQAVRRIVRGALHAVAAVFAPRPGQRGARPARVLRRFVALWRARRR